MLLGGRTVGPTRDETGDVLGTGDRRVGVTGVEGRELQRQNEILGLNEIGYSKGEVRKKQRLWQSGDTLNKSPPGPGRNASGCRLLSHRTLVTASLVSLCSVNFAPRLHFSIVQYPVLHSPTPGAVPLLRPRTMSNSGDDNDSRTASVGVQRNTTNASSSSSRRGSQERSRKRQKRMGDRDVRDFVPQGATFSVNQLDIDPESASSSDGDLGSDQSLEEGENVVAATGTDGNRESGTEASIVRNGLKDTRFDAVNDRYRRSRSHSASEDGTSSEGEDSEIDDDDDDTSSGSGSTHLSDDSEDSGSLDSEKADDSIVLNLGSRNQENRNGERPAQGSECDLESRRVIEEGLLNGKISDTRDGTADEAPLAKSKEEALRRFSDKYPTAPSTLVDLDHHDFEVQARYLHFDRDINDINLDLPIGCTECLREGHLAEVCPSKEVRLLSFIPRDSADYGSAYTAARGTNTKAASARRGADARNAESAATPRTSAPT